MGNPLVRIELPGYLKDGAKLLKMTGQGKKIDELLAAWPVVSINAAADQVCDRDRAWTTSEAGHGLS